MDLVNDGLPKTLLDKYIKNDGSQYPLTSNMVKGLKHCSNLQRAPLPYLLITAKDIEFEKVSLSDMQNIVTVCSHIHYR